MLKSVGKYTIVTMDMITSYDIFRFAKKENRLTAQLMLALEMNRDTLLKRFLELCQLEHEIKNLSSMTIRLQDSEEESRPDAVLSQNGSVKILFVESKLDGPVNANQLILHVKSGKGHVPVLCISRGKTEPMEIQKARETLSKLGSSEDLVRWLGWQQMYTELNSLSSRIQEKPEIAGLTKSLEKENLAELAFKGFKKDDLVRISQFVRIYPELFENAQLLIDGVIERVKKKNQEVKVYFKRKQTTVSPIKHQTFAGFRYPEMENTWAYLTVDFSDGHLRLELSMESEKLKELSDSQVKNYLEDLRSREGFKLETPRKEEIDSAKQLRDGGYVSFSRYYCCDSDVLYLNPQELVKLISEDIFWLLDFLKTRKLCVGKESELE